MDVCKVYRGVNVRNVRDVRDVTRDVILTLTLRDLISYFPKF